MNIDVCLPRDRKLEATPSIQELYQQDETDVIARVHTLKQQLGDQLLILGHHYQREEVIGFADITGDSLKLAQEAAKTTAPYIIFCGVHFMAEMADVLTSDAQVVILPDPAAGCSMADMANDEQVRRCWDELSQVITADDCVTPVTYINSTAALKAFCGEHEGIVCTSGNAKRVMQWAWDKREKILFFPDQHLGENTALTMGINDEDMIIWDPFKPMGGNTTEDIQRAKLILWKGFCSVHQLFKPEHAATMRSNHPDIQILAHPECSREVCETADFVGSTEVIIQHVNNAPSGSKFAIATELNLVNRLRITHPDKPIWFLSPTVSMCSTMFRTDPQHLCYAMQAIVNGEGYHQIKVDHADKKNALKSLQAMLDLG
ncbi:MAG: quinolinate synthase NadA [Ghiorsea sp.]|nr:quinolinate synthase NadA [Ghiorsea sp.]